MFYVLGLILLIVVFLPNKRLEEKQEAIKSINKKSDLFIKNRLNKHGSNKCVRHI